MSQQPEEHQPNTTLGDGPPPEKRMKLRYAGKCRLCGTALPARTDAIYERTNKTVRCLDCSATAAAREFAPPKTPADPAVESIGVVETLVPIAPVPAGQNVDATKPPQLIATPTEPEMEVAADTAGASARQEYERRRAKDEARLRDKWGRFGNIAVAMASERQSTAAWRIGAVGEERLGAVLDTFVCAQLATLHDRRIPGSRANIDHMVITPAGIWVIDAKRYKGRPDLKVEGGILRPVTTKLTVAGRDRTNLVDGVLKQVDRVSQAVPGAPVTGVLCFLEADWPLIGGALKTRGVHVVWPRKLYKMLANLEENLIDVEATRDALARWFKPASA